VYKRQLEEEYARGVLEMTGVAGVTASSLIERYAGSDKVRRSVVDAALADRSWGYGHVVVDEAQELSPMQWRLLMRRCPSRSMTVVGDLAQAGSVAAPTEWGDIFETLAPGRWSVQGLSVNYRTPEPIMALAADVLAASGARVRAPRSVRGGTPPRIVGVEVDPTQRAAARTASVLRALEPWVQEEGRSAVIVPPSMQEPMAQALVHGLGHSLVAFGTRALDSRVSVLTVAETKGLEFDQVVVVEPAELIGASPRGPHDLYVALTRATRELVVVHTEPLPPGFRPAARQGG